MEFVKLQSFVVGVDGGEGLASVRLIFITKSSQHLADAIRDLEAAKEALEHGKDYQSGATGP